MKYVEFKESIIETTIKNSHVVQLLEDGGIGDDQLLAVLTELNKIITAKLGDNKSVENILRVLGQSEMVLTALRQVLPNEQTITDALEKINHNKTTSTPDTENKTSTDPSKKTARNKNVSKAMQSIPDDLPEYWKKFLNRTYDSCDKQKSQGDMIKFLDKKIAALDSKLNPKPVKESASGGSTSAGSIASVSAPMMGVIKRMPPGQSFFAPTYTAEAPKKTHKLAKINKKRQRR